MTMNQLEFPGLTWLHDLLLDALSEKLCMEIHCTTCLSHKFRGMVATAADEQIAGESSDRRLVPIPGFGVTDQDRAIAQGLAHIQPIGYQDAGSSVSQGEQEEGVRFLIFNLWAHMGGSRNEPELECMLIGSWAGEVLAEMQAHHKERMAEQAAREAYHAPAAVRERREENKRWRQEQHAERLKIQKEKARAWHAAQ